MAVIRVLPYGLKVRLDARKKRLRFSCQDFSLVNGATGQVNRGLADSGDAANGSGNCLRTVDQRFETKCAQGDHKCIHRGNFIGDGIGAVDEIVRAGNKNGRMYRRVAQVEGQSGSSVQAGQCRLHRRNCRKRVREVRGSSHQIVLCRGKRRHFSSEIVLCSDNGS